MIRTSIFILLLVAMPAAAHSVRWCSSPWCGMCNRLQAAHNAAHAHPHGALARPVAQPVYSPTPHWVVAEAMEKAELKPGMVMVDLGCGDGRVVVHAAWFYGCKAVGVDTDPNKIKQCQQLAKEYGVEDLAKFYQRDVTQVDLSKADVVYVYLEPNTLTRLLPYLRQMKKDAKLIAYQHHVKELVLQHYDTERRLFVWTDVPNSVMEKKDENIITIRSHRATTVRFTKTRRRWLTRWRM